MSDLAPPASLPRPLFMLFATLALGACATAPPPATSGTATVAGCYQFEWNDGARRLGLPWGIVLEARPLEEGWPVAARGEVRRTLTATSPSARADHPFGYWLRTPVDSIEVGYPAGGGIVLLLAPDGADLVGVGRAVGDALRPGSSGESRASAAVAARRVTCGASPE